MLTFLLIWAVSSAAMFAAAIVVRGRHGLARVAILTAFWPPILTGLFISFLIWWVRKSIEANAARSAAL